MKDIKIRIRKKVRMPVNHPVYTHNSRWCLVASLDYNVCNDLFFYFNKRQGFKNDAQFALWLKRKFGVGVYSCLAWSHGKEGFFEFMKIEIDEELYRRLPKKETQEQKENRELYVEKRRLQNQLKHSGDEDNKVHIQENLANLNDETSLNKEIINIDKGRNGCAPILKTVPQIFKAHQYQELDDCEENNSTKQQEDLRIF